MNITRFITPVRIIAIAALLSISCSSDGEDRKVRSFESDPLAEKRYRQMLETVKKAETIYYESEYRWGIDTLELARTEYKIWMKKPNFVRLEAKGIMNPGEGVLIGDGEYFWIYWPTGRPHFPGTDSITYNKTGDISYMKKPAPPGGRSISHDVGLFGSELMSMTVLEPSIFHGYSDPMQPYLNGVNYIGRDSVDGIACDVIEAVFMDRQRIRALWIAEEDNLPRKMEEITKTSPGSRTVERWSNVRLNQPVPDDIFSWEPPDGWVEYREPRLEDGLLGKGEKAPDFDLVLADSSRFRLSDHQGKAVWIIFWRAGCQACREEMEYIHNIKGKYKTDDLVVVGFNCTDNRDIALKYIDQHGIPFSHIIDSSEQATNIFFREYQKLPGMSAVPLNYVIGPGGKVAEAWYGFDSENDQIEKMLDKISRL